MTASFVTALCLASLVSPPAAQPVSEVASNPEYVTMLAQAERQASQQLETLLLNFVQVFDEQLSRQAEGKKELHQRYTERELQDLLVQRLQEASGEQMADIALNIHPDRLVASGRIQAAAQSLRVEVQLGISAVNDRPYVEIHQVRIETHLLSEQSRGLLQARVNGQIQRLRLSLRLKEIAWKEGWALISATLGG